jgi:NAD(P)-dependent dehydrogenase (short-subunit alcohol dehydrogenase family)
MTASTTPENNNVPAPQAISNTPPSNISSLTHTGSGEGLIRGGVTNSTNISFSPPSRPNTKISFLDQKQIFPGIAEKVRAFEGEYTYNYSAHSARMLMDIKPLFAVVMSVVPPLVSAVVFPFGTVLTAPLTLLVYLGAVAGVSRLLVRGNMNTIEKDLTGRIVVVTGGTGGMGREVVAEMLRMGATVIVVAKPNPQAEAETVELAKQRTGGKFNVLPNITLNSTSDDNPLGNLDAGAQLVFMPLDLGYFSMTRTWTRRYKTISNNKLDLLIHCCGVIHHKPVVNKFGDDDQLSSNLLGPYLFTEALLPVLDESRGRVVFTTTSAMALIGRKAVQKYLMYKKGTEWNPEYVDDHITTDREKAPGVSPHKMESMGSNTAFELVIERTKSATNVSRSYEDQDKRAITSDPLFNKGVRKQPLKVPTAAEAAAASAVKHGRKVVGRGGGKHPNNNSDASLEEENARADSYVERFIMTYVNFFKRITPSSVKDRPSSIRSTFKKSPSTTNASPSSATSSSSASSTTAAALKYDCLEQFGFTKLGCIFYVQDLGSRSYYHSMKMAEALRKSPKYADVNGHGGVVNSSNTSNAAVVDAAFKFTRKEELDPSVNRSDSAMFSTCVVNPGGVITGHFNDIPQIASFVKYGYYLGTILMRTPYEGSQTIVNAALRDDLVNGGYYQNSHYTPSALSEVACDVKEREALMKWVKARTYALLDAHDTKRGNGTSGKGTSSSPSTLFIKGYSTSPSVAAGIRVRKQ